MSTNDKRVYVCGLSFLPLSKATVINIPGQPRIGVTGNWTDIKISSGEWKESVEFPGKPVAQELKVTLTDVSDTNEIFLRNLFSDEGLLLLSFTNGIQKVVGTDEFPVLVAVERSGEPAKLYLSIKRDSPEWAKYL